MTAEPIKCNHCRVTIDDGGSEVVRGWHYQLARLPGGAITGELWRFCSLHCLVDFVGGRQ